MSKIKITFEELKNTTNISHGPSAGVPKWLTVGLS